MNDNDRALGVANETPMEVGLTVASMMQEVFPEFLLNEGPAVYVASVVMNVLRERDRLNRPYKGSLDGLMENPNVWFDFDPIHSAYSVAFCPEYIKTKNPPSERRLKKIP